MKNLSSNYNTKQRRQILNYLKSSHSRLISAEDIFIKLKAGGCPVGKSTIYRYLGVLENQGQIIKYLCAQGAEAYFQYIGEACRGHQYHLKCKGCGRLIQLECELLNDLKGHISDCHNFYVDDSPTVFSGSCSKCAGSKG